MIAAAFSFLALVVFFLSLSASHAFEVSYRTVSLWGSLALLFWFLFNRTAARSPSPIALCVTLYLVFCYLMPGILHVSANRFPFFNPGYSEEAVAIAGLVVLAFCLFFIAGYFVYFLLSSGVISSGDWAELSPLLPHAGRSRWIALLFFALAISAAFSIGLSVLNLSRGDLTAEDALGPAGLILVAVARVSSFLGLVYSIISLIRWKTKLDLIIVLVSVPIFLMGNNPASAPRFLLASYAVAGFFIFVPLNKMSKCILVASFVFGIFTLFPLLSEYARGDIAQFSIWNWQEYWFTSGDFDGFQSTVNVVEMVFGQGFRFGAQLLSAALFFIPRSLWQSKSAGTGGDAGEFMGLPFVNLSSPLPAELYVDFGFIGVICFSFAIGIFCAACDEKYRRFSALAVRELLVPAAVLSGYSFILLRGSLVGVLGPVVLSVALVVLANLYLFRRPLRHRDVSVKHAVRVIND